MPSCWALEPAWRKAFDTSERAIKAHNRAEEIYLGARRNGTATAEQAAAVDRSDRRVQDTMDRLCEIEQIILNLPAASLAGAAVKARMVQAYADEPDPEMVSDLIENVLRLADRAEPSADTLAVLKALDEDARPGNWADIDRMFPEDSAASKAAWEALDAVLGKAEQPA